MKRMLSVAGVGLLALMAAAGCNAERHADIPVSANVVAEGNNRISYEAPRAGTVWVYNQGNGNMEYSGKVSRGDMLVVDPDHDRITVNGRNVNDKPLTTLDLKKIFFEPAKTDAVIERRTVEERTYREVR